MPDGHPVEMLNRQLDPEVWDLHREIHLTESEYRRSLTPGNQSFGEEVIEKRGSSSTLCHCCSSLFKDTAASFSIYKVLYSISYKNPDFDTVFQVKGLAEVTLPFSWIEQKGVLLFC